MALTGAGISVESGIPDFRGAEGLWSRFDPMEYGSIDAFRADPGRVWRMLVEMDAMLRRAEPNPAHYVLAELERRGILETIITQNVDSLHQRAGSTRVIEFHGHGRSLRCDRCGRSHAREAVDLDRLPPRCSCGGALRPEFVFFGEDIPRKAYAEAMAAVHTCDSMLIVGTSAMVAPASSLPGLARENGAFIVEINPSESALAGWVVDLAMRESAGVALPGILSELDKIKSLKGNGK